MTTARKPASPLKKHLGFWLRMISNSVSQSFARKVDAQGVTVAEWVVLREMYSHRDTIAPSHIAALTGLSRGAVSKLVDRLLKKKLVIRSESARDRRYQDLQLSPSGVALVPRLSRLADENDAEFFGELSSTERHALTSVLRKLADANGVTNAPID